MLDLALFVVLAAGGTSDCLALDAKARGRADALLERLHPYDCCDRTLAECLDSAPGCRLVVRLANNVCRRVARGEASQDIEAALTGRARSMMRPGKPKPIDLAGLVPAGEAEAPVTVVMYACGRCPFCAKLTPALHRAVTRGSLAGKVRLFFKPFPIRGHAFSKEAAMAFAAASRLGRFWEYALHFYARFDDYGPERQIAWAREVGLDSAEFARLITDDGVRDEVVAAKKEGLRLGVDATPTLFIDGYRYQGELHIAELVDVLEEAYEAATKDRGG